MIDLIYFDTNFFYNVKNKIIKKETIEKLKNFSIRKGSRLSYTPITFVEIASHINREEKSNFEYYKAIFELIKELCGDNILEDPGYTLATVLEAPSPKRVENISLPELNKIRDLICSAKSYDELIGGQICYWNGMLAKVKLYEDSVKNIRTDYEGGWILEMYKFVVNTINPDYFKRLQKDKIPRVTDKKLRGEIIAFLEGSIFKETFVDASLCKAMNLPKESLIGKSQSKKVEQLLVSISAYFTAYKTIIKKIATDGYNVGKNKNDFNDLHFLIYLGLKISKVFLSQEKELKKKIQGCSQEKQMLNIDELLSIR